MITGFIVFFVFQTGFVWPVRKNDEFCVQQRGILCSKTRDFVLKMMNFADPNDAHARLFLVSRNDEFSLTHEGFCIKMMNCALKTRNFAFKMMKCAACDRLWPHRAGKFPDFPGCSRIFNRKIKNNMEFVPDFLELVF